MTAGFAELVCATNYSFLRGASHPADMVARALDLGLAGIGIADRNSVAGVVRAHMALRDAHKAAAEIGAPPLPVRSMGAVGRTGGWSVWLTGVLLRRWPRRCRQRRVRRRSEP